MQGKDNLLKTAELSTEQSHNMIDGIPNNAPLTVPQARPVKPVDRVIEPPRKKRNQERKDR